MATPCIPQLLFRFHGNSKPVVAAFDVAHANSDGGALLLKAIDTQWGLTEGLATCLDDPRQPGKIRHPREVIQALIPLGLAAVEEALQGEVRRLAGERYQRPTSTPPTRRPTPPWGPSSGSSGA